MYYSAKFNLCFFHTPKTGGTSFREWLKEGISDLELVINKRYHETLSETAKVFKDFDNTRIVTILRNPFDLVVSTYFYWRKFPKDYRNERVQMAHKSEFNDFVKWFVVNRDNYKTFLEVDGKIPVNIRFIRLENLIEESQEVFDGLGMNLDASKIKHKNKSKHKPSSCYFTSETITLIKNRYRWVFDTGFY